MRRASKKRQEPEFETKRLTASTNRPSPPARRHIPSLLDIATLAPPRYQSRSSSNRDGVRSATRGSPCYSEDDDSVASRHNLDCGRFRESGIYRDRREIKGPQVRYPCGRPQSRRNDGQRNAANSSSSQQQSRQDKARDSAYRPSRESSSNKASIKINRVARFAECL
ncbi:hypothetical protein KIN20_004371 [Parelaphostrongylus tenuis]|uniref:Uncharacterized protein n=1 Tax=Parelaphostrongylus tenuis TaxID=148309 RepID=A0AAD5LYD7_PARTN|nr:hypothetical protein KIN20_004371 [Parelaphostrongylus tenuis]